MVRELAVRPSGPKELSIEKAKYFYRPYWRALNNGQFDPYMPRKVVVVGCGGNGGYVIPWIARYISQSRLDEIRGMQMTLIDGDVIEPKNVSRQNFVPSDIGQNKAEIMADRCNRNLGMEVEAIPEYFSKKHLDNRTITAGDLVIGCVDRHPVRLLLSQWVADSRENFYIDVGNELSAGQLFLSGWPTVRSDREPPMLADRNIRPIQIHDFYPEIAKADVTKAAPSCAELTAAGQQRMSTNLTAANLVFQAFEALMLTAEIPYYEVTFGPTSFRTVRFNELQEKRDSATGGVLLRDKS